MTGAEILETPDLIAAGVAGDDVRRRLHGARTTFARVLEVHVEAPLQGMPPGAQPGEIRLVGRPSSLDAALRAVRAAVALSDGVPVTFSSVVDLLPLGAVDEVVGALAAAGLAAMAQMPLDTGLVTDAERLARSVAAAGLPIQTITIERLADGDRIALCELAASLQQRVGGFRAFAPLPRSMSVAKPTTGYDDVKMIALARVVCAGVPSIQVDWQLYGPKMAQVALTVGADDVDNVSAADAGILGTRRSPLEEIRRNIRAAALDPIERDGLFREREGTRG